MRVSRRTFGKGLTAVAAASLLPVAAGAQATPIKLGFSIALSGPLAGGGATGLIGMQIWADEVNAAGGILGRPVELVFYDDQSNGSQTPGIYAKLIDVDRVDLLLTPYGTNVSAPIMPLVKQRNRLIFGMLGTGLNSRIQHDRFFCMAPWGPDPELQYRGFVDLGHEKGFKKIAIVAVDGEAQQTAAAGARRVAKEYGMDMVLDLKIPPNTNDLSGAFNQLKNAQPEMIFFSTYPNETVAAIQAIGEVGLPDSVQMLGGGMVGLQYAAILKSLGSKVNGIVNLHTYSVEDTFATDTSRAFQEIYHTRATAQNADPLGHLTAPFWYAAGQVIKTAAEAVGSVDEAAMAEWLHANTVETIVGAIDFGENGEWAENRVLMVQYHDVADNDVDQFRSPGKAVIVHPANLASGELQVPFASMR